MDQGNQKEFGPMDKIAGGGNQVWAINLQPLLRLSKWRQQLQLCLHCSVLLYAVGFDQKIKLFYPPRFIQKQIKLEMVINCFH